MQQSSFSKDDIDLKRRFSDKFKIFTDAEEEYRKYWENYPLNQFHNYLILDVSKLNKKQVDQITFLEFVDSIIYIGKGQGSEVHNHFWEALTTTNETSKKIEKIQECLNGDGLTYVEHFFTNIENESISNKGEMIEAIGLGNLLNEQDGDLFWWFNNFIEKYKENNINFGSQDAIGILGTSLLLKVYEEVFKKQKVFKIITNKTYSQKVLETYRGDYLKNKKDFKKIRL